jgi:hypothetical protein
MKKIFFLLLTALMVNGQWSMVNGQTLAIHTDALTLLATPDEVGEMMFSGGMLSIGDTVIDVTTIGLKGSPTNIAKSFTPPQKGAGVMLEGADDNAVVADLTSRLTAKHIL